jgi:ATP-dependent DNA helicase RecQ
VIAARRVELAQMQAYLQHDGCLMEFLVRVLDDPDPVACGHCVNCTGRGLPRTVDDELVRAAVSFLRRDLRPVKPRLQWALDAAEGLSGRITPPNEAGMALCVYGDAGWGRDVQRGKYVDGAFSRELIVASARAIRDRWHPTPPPTWVTALPSSAKRGLVDAFARSLADLLGLPYVDALTVLAGAEQQKDMQNSAQQLRNAHHKLDIDGSVVLPGPVLLVDDIVDSGWTLTVAGWLLRTHGSGAVHPFVLAVASARDG